MRKQATIRARGRLRCRWKYGGCWECEPETDSYSKAMEKRCGCGRLETGTRFQKYRGIGNPDIPSGRKSIGKWLRGMRGE